MNYTHNETDPNSLSGQRAYCIYEDSKGQIWVGTSGDGLNLFNRKEKKFIHFIHKENNPKSISNNDIHSIVEDNDGNIWVSTEGGGLNLLNQKLQTFTHFFHNDNDRSSISHNNLTSLIKDKFGIIWVGTLGGGLCRLNKDNYGKYSFETFKPNTEDLNRSKILTLFANQRNGIWIGTENGGLDYFDCNLKSFTNYQLDVNTPNSLNNNSIHAIYEDKTRNLWVGTYTGGVNVVKKNKKKIYTYRKIPGNPNSLSYNAVSCFFEDSDSSLWIGTDGGGINKWDRKNGDVIHFNSKNSSLKSEAILAICNDKDNDIWIGGWECGLNLYNRKSKTFTTLSEGKDPIPNNNIFDILVDHKGRLWMAFGGIGFARYDKKNKTFTTYTPTNSRLPSIWVLNLAEDYAGNILLGHTYGFSIFNPENETFENYSRKEKDKNSLSNDQVSIILPVHDSTLWIGTINGLNHFNPKNKKFSRYYEQNGLPNNNIAGLVEDDHGFIWISTDDGISKLDPTSGSFKNYTLTDGLQGKSYIRNSCSKTSRGEMLFGGTNGFNIFYPDSLFDNPNLPPVVITDFTIFNKPVKVGLAGSPLSKNISQSPKIVLSYKQSVFSFEFVALDYTAPEQNQYAYKLEGFDKEWNYVGTKRTASYTNLNAGNYVFRVKGSNNDGKWNETGVSLHITVTPPLWKTWWFRIFAIAFILFLISSFYSIRLRTIKRNNLLLEIQVEERTKELKVKNKLLKNQANEMNEINVLLEERQQQIEEQSEILLTQKEELIRNNKEIFNKNKLLEKQADNLNETNTLLEERQQQIEEQSEELLVQKEELENVNQELQELNATKDKFFSIIAHDIKNPFNTIMGFSELMLANINKWSDEKKLQIASIIYNSSKGLYELLENLLQWSRSQRGLIEFNPVAIELNKQINVAILLLKDSSEAKRIEIKTNFSKNEIVLNADLRMLDTILRNLLSNAIKFTYPEGNIEIKTEIVNSYAMVSVIDNGKGMSNEALAKLFRIDAHQSSSGTQDEKGTGLGLILVKEFITKHGGDIKVESEEEKGSALPLNTTV